MKNIAAAIAMYISDYDDGCFPGEGDLSEVTYFAPSTRAAYCDMIHWANPYLREQVVLDDYVKNRDVWRCPDAKVQNGPRTIVPMGRDGFWVNSWKDGNWEGHWQGLSLQPGLPSRLGRRGHRLLQARFRHRGLWEDARTGRW